VKATIEKMRNRGFTPDEIRRFVDAELNACVEEARVGH
jgi:hypothetical protein